MTDPDAPRFTDAAAVREPGAAPARRRRTGLPSTKAKRAVVDAFEREILGRLLRAHRGNVSRAAQSARKERRDFGRLLKKHQLDPRAF